MQKQRALKLLKIVCSNKMVKCTKKIGIAQSRCKNSKGGKAGKKKCLRKTMCGGKSGRKKSKKKSK